MNFKLDQFVSFSEVVVLWRFLSWILSAVHLFIYLFSSTEYFNTMCKLLKNNIFIHILINIVIHSHGFLMFHFHISSHQQIFLKNTSPPKKVHKVSGWRTHQEKSLSISHAHSTDDHLVTFVAFKIEYISMYLWDKKGPDKKPSHTLLHFVEFQWSTGEHHLQLHSDPVQQSTNLNNSSAANVTTTNLGTGCTFLLLGWWYFEQQWRNQDLNKVYMSDSIQ